jgi:hypothetical protein
LVLVETALLVVQDQPTKEVMGQIPYLVPLLQQVAVVVRPLFCHQIILEIVVVQVVVVLILIAALVLAALERQTKDMPEEMELHHPVLRLQILGAAVALEV